MLPFLLLLLCLSPALPFLLPPPPSPALLAPPLSANIFKFLSDKTSEGLTQLTTIASAVASGNATAGLASVKEYVDQENEILRARVQNIFPRPELDLVEELRKTRPASPEAVEAACGTLKTLLLRSDVGTAASDLVAARMSKSLLPLLKDGPLKYSDLLAAAKVHLLATLAPPPRPPPAADCVPVYLLMGANGMGKTTTIGKVRRKRADRAGERSERGKAAGGGRAGEGAGRRAHLAAGGGASEAGGEERGRCAGRKKPLAAWNRRRRRCCCSPAAEAGSISGCRGGRPPEPPGPTKHVQRPS
jgi:hypothetical protein